jgi:hypothetical protein
VQKFDAPKATLMSYIIKGILSHKLPWALVLLGAMIAVVLEMIAGIRCRSLPSPRLLQPNLHRRNGSLAGGSLPKSEIPTQKPIRDGAHRGG